MANTQYVQLLEAFGGVEVTTPGVYPVVNNSNITCQLSFAGEDAGAALALDVKVILTPPSCAFH